MILSPLHRLYCYTYYTTSHELQVVHNEVPFALETPFSSTNLERYLDNRKCVSLSMSCYIEFYTALGSTLIVSLCYEVNQFQAMFYTMNLKLMVSTY